MKRYVYMNELDPPLIDKAYADMRKLKSQECDLGSNPGFDIYSGTLTSSPTRLLDGRGV